MIGSSEGHPFGGRWHRRARWDEGGPGAWFGGGGWPGIFGQFGGSGRGRGGPWGGGRRAERFLERGDLKYVILDLLKDQPRHGYDIIRALEQRFGGFYSPSPGVVYPTLQLLEDQGYITGTQQEGKKVYAITDEGRALLGARGDTMSGIYERMRAWDWRRHGTPHPEVGELMRDLQSFGWLLFSPEARGWWADADKVRRIRATLAKTRGEIESIVRGSAPAEPPTTVL